MARAVVLTGVPRGIEETSYVSKRGRNEGQEVHQIVFQLWNEATDLVGSFQIKATDDAHKTLIQDAALKSRPLDLVCGVRCVRYEKEIDGQKEIRDWPEFYVRSVLNFPDLDLDAS